MRFELAPHLISTYKDEGSVEIEPLFDPAPLFEKDGPFTERRDRFRKDPAVKKLLFSSTTNQIAAILSSAKSLCIGSDQLYKEGELPEEFALQTVADLPVIASFSKVQCALLIEPEGHFRFLNPYFAAKAPEGPALIATWIPTGCRFAPSKEDKASHLLMKEGYAAGDVLDVRTHPIVKK